MRTQYELAHLSMIAVPPARLAAVAAAAGFDFTGFRLTPSPSTGIDHRILGDDRALASLRRAVDDAGIGILDVEVIRMKDPSAVEEARPLLEAAQALGARYVIATVEDDDPVRRVDTLAQRRRRSPPQHGTSIAVEFMLFSAARDLATCVEIVQQAAPPNVVVLADSLHLERSGGHPDDLRRTRRSCSPTRRSAARPAPDRPPTRRSRAARACGAGCCRTRATSRCASSSRRCPRGRSSASSPRWRARPTPRTRCPRRARCSRSARRVAGDAA